jgi:hypothetical protein
MSPLQRSRSRLVIPVALVLAALVTPSSRGQKPEEKCNDPVPSPCSHAKFLGTDKGCACFVCNPDDKATRKVVCTQKDADKKTLFGRVDQPARQPSTGPGTVPGAR